MRCTLSVYAGPPLGIHWVQMGPSLIHSEPSGILFWKHMARWPTAVHRRQLPLRGVPSTLLRTLKGQLRIIENACKTSAQRAIQKTCKPKLRNPTIQATSHALWRHPEWKSNWLLHSVVSSAGRAFAVYAVHLASNLEMSWLQRLSLFTAYWALVAPCAWAPLLAHVFQRCDKITLQNSASPFQPFKFKRFAWVDWRLY